jgi:hypothetical protein
LKERRPNSRDPSETVLVHERSAHHPIGDDSPGDRWSDSGQRIDLRRGGNVEIELAADVSAPIARRRRPTRLLIPTAFPRTAAAASLLCARRVRCLELMIERWLRRGDDFACRRADHSDAGAKDGDRANENECFMIGS